MTATATNMRARADKASGKPRALIMRTDVLVFLALLALVTVGATIMAQAGLVSVSFVKLLGKTL
ncbi:MAG: hypothetical protein HKP54_09740, partial [Boseongicola sp.]|nr:hypothetical protein [Boseongicola sp.]